MPVLLAYSVLWLERNVLFFLCFGGRTGRHGNSVHFYTAVNGLEQEPEKGERCTVCYRLRLEQTARYAAAHGFEWFCTTLSISPMKDPIRINALGQELGEKYNVCFLPSEFRKKDGYKRSLQLSAEYGLYRQDYCGCVFSKQERGV